MTSGRGMRLGSMRVRLKSANLALLTLASLTGLVVTASLANAQAASGDPAHTIADKFSRESKPTATSPKAPTQAANTSAAERRAAEEQRLYEEEMLARARAEADARTQDDLTKEKVQVESGGTDSKGASGVGAATQPHPAEQTRDREGEARKLTERLRAARRARADEQARGEAENKARTEAEAEAKQRAEAERKLRASEEAKSKAAAEAALELARQRLAQRAGRLEEKIEAARRIRLAAEPRRRGPTRIDGAPIATGSTDESDSTSDKYLVEIGPDSDAEDPDDSVDADDSLPANGIAGDGGGWKPPINAPKGGSGTTAPNAASKVKSHYDAELKRVPPNAAAAHTGRATVLLVMTPGHRGIRRWNKTADPMLCIEGSCYISNGANAAAQQISRGQGFGPGIALGKRAGACRNQLACVFRDVEMTGDAVWMQPIDLRILRHDRRESRRVSADKTCAVQRGRLVCRQPVAAGDYRAWIVPEGIANAAGAAGLQAALDSNLETSISAYAPR